ncbi:hypothetical protein AN948_01890 [Rhodococcus sp. ADH]|nr:hypothetical protein AN948_01890 [Rhodococcus sp. ADH]RGP47370.1 hypothetical protein AWH04_08545 [Rhodococcus erythropolis]
MDAGNTIAATCATPLEQSDDQHTRFPLPCHFSRVAPVQNGKTPGTLEAAPNRSENDDDSAGAATRISNRIRGLLAGIHRP